MCGLEIGCLWSSAAEPFKGPNFVVSMISHTEASLYCIQNMLWLCPTEQGTEIALAIKAVWCNQPSYSEEMSSPIISGPSANIHSAAERFMREKRQHKPNMIPVRATHKTPQIQRSIFAVYTKPYVLSWQSNKVHTHAHTRAHTHAHTHTQTGLLKYCKLPYTVILR